MFSLYEIIIREMLICDVVSSITSDFKTKQKMRKSVSKLGRDSCFKFLTQTIT